MAGEKIPLSSERVFKHKGVFDMKGTYAFLRDFLENSRHYDLTEKELESKNDGASKKLKSVTEAEQEYNDYYKVIIKFELDLDGKEVVVENKKYIDGTASLKVNSYLQLDFMSKREIGPLASFLEKVYNKYIGKDEFSKVAGSASRDVAELINRFKQSVNSP